jgi:N-acetylglutamate synthase-like GNAT family acetyltransferase
MSTQKKAIKIRQADVSDADKITNLINRAFKLAEAFFIDEDRIDLATVLQSLEKGEFLVAEDDGEISGCVYLEHKADRTYLGLLSVDPRQQQSGLGSFIMSYAEEYCRARQSKFIDILTVNLREELPGFYTRRGYVQTGTSPFPGEIATKVPCHFINLTKRL